MRMYRLPRYLAWTIVFISAFSLLFRLVSQTLHVDELEALVVDQGQSTAYVGQGSCVCATASCMSLYETAGSNNNTDRIPRLRHILWKSTHVSSYFARQLRTWHAVQPNWTYVLWRDSDLDKFVARYYTGVLTKFRSLSKKIMQLDMVRYMILHKFGGVYADLDYVLLHPLDRFLKFSAIVTRETEAHALYHFGMSRFPPPVLPSPAFMMSEPGHGFFHYALFLFNCRREDAGVLNFAGPLGLASVLKRYADECPPSPKEAALSRGLVVVPPSRNFYAFEDNSLASSASSYKWHIVRHLQSLCSGISRGSQKLSANLTAYCLDVTNLDPITDRRDLAYAVHDYNKSHSSYDPAGAKEFEGEKQVDIRSVLPNVLMAGSIL